MTAQHPADCKCLCCDETTPQPCSVDFHRDTGEEWTTQLDATERLHSNTTGDVSLYTFEDIEINCTIDSVTIEHEVIGFGNSSASIAARMRVSPSTPSFTALRHWWPNDGATFDCWSHHDHLAYGSLFALYTTRHGVDKDDFGSGSFNLNRSTIAEGYAYGDGETQALFGRVVKFTNDAGDDVLLYSFLETGPDHCWLARNLADFYVLDEITGVFTAADDDTLLSGGLIRSLFAPRRDLTIGWAFGISSTWDTKTEHQSEVEPEYYASTIISELCQSGSFLFNCLCAFYGKTQLIASCSGNPDGYYFPNTFVQNVEPVEMRDFNLTLDLTVITDPPGEIFRDPLFEIRTAGYAFYGIAVDAFLSGQTSLPITVEVWYLPCQLLIIAFSSSVVDGYPCEKTWVQLRHQHTTDYDDGFATQPSTSGYHDIEFPQFGFTFRYVGTECLDDTGHDFHTNCYSLDPINIGYIRHVQDQYAFGPFVTVPCTDDPCTLDDEHIRRWCGFHQMTAAGLTFTQIEPGGLVPTIGRFYMDISEVPE